MSLIDPFQKNSLVDLNKATGGKGEEADANMAK